MRIGTGSTRGVVVCACALGAAALAACTSTRTIGYQRPLPPKARAPQPAPPDAVADALVMTLGAAPRDTNGNGYPDMIYATAHLFDRRYAPPLHEDGSFTFQLYAIGDAARPAAAPLHEWRFNPGAAADASGRSGFGDCYRFRLSLLDDGGTDELGVPVADMVCRFDPGPGGPPVSSEVTTIQIGRRVLVPQLHWDEQREPDTAPSADATH